MVQTRAMGNSENYRAGLIEKESARVNLMMHDIKSPFLASNIQYSTQTKKVQIVRDPASDFAKLIKKDSTLLKYIRERNGNTEERKLPWLLAGSKTGDVESNTREQERGLLLIKAAWEKLMNAIRENKIVIVAGQARSGEMTKLVKDLFDEGYTTDKLIIGCIQPKRVAAVSAAKRTAEKMKKDLGQEVGYSTRFEDVSSEKTIIKYMTDVVLLRESLNDPDLDKYSVIIVDEAHERSLHRDVLLGMLRIAASNRKYLKIIIISPTECVKRFSDFFISAPVVEISEGTFPVNTFFLKDLEEDYVDAAVRQAISIHLQECEGDILIFMTGQEDIETTCLLVAEKLEKMEGAPEMLILPIYSTLPSDVQAKIFDVSTKRKCIVATNIAETSLTLDRVKFVIDIGFCKLKVYNPKIGMDVLLETPISQASANQRSGLAGRTGPGV